MAHVAAGSGPGSGPGPSVAAAPRCGAAALSGLGLDLSNTLRLLSLCRFDRVEASLFFGLPGLDLLLSFDFLLDCALLLDFCGATLPTGAAECSTASAGRGHYERAVALDGSDRRAWQLWAASFARDESLGGEAERRHAAAGFGGGGGEGRPECVQS